MPVLTPMMQQYLQMKAKNPDCILFFRLGDFYEMFMDDARLVSKELELTLTTRDRHNPNPDEQVPMCGVPYHSSEAYIARLVQRGYKVAICEQTEDPALAKGLVQREIVRVVTPGTVTESSMLQEQKNNYFACVFGQEKSFGLAFVDISTGACYATTADEDKACNELGRFAPREVLLGGTAADNPALEEVLTQRVHAACEPAEDALFEVDLCTGVCRKQFRELGEAAQNPLALQALGALMQRLKDLSKSDLSHISRLQYYVPGQFMELDLTARRNLEITRDPPQQGEARHAALGAGRHADLAGRADAALLAGSAAAEPPGNCPAAGRRRRADSPHGGPRGAAALAALRHRLRARHGPPVHRHRLGPRPGSAGGGRRRPADHPRAAGSYGGPAAAGPAGADGPAGGRLRRALPGYRREPARHSAGGRPHRQRLRRGAGSPARHSERRRRPAGAAGDSRARSHRHPQSARALQPRLWLLHRGSQVIYRAGTGTLRPQADHLHRRALLHAGAEGAGELRAQRQGKNRHAGVRPLPEAAAAGAGAVAAHSGHGLVRGPGGHADFAGLCGRARRLCPSGG